MKKWTVILTGILFALVIVGGAIAQEKAKTETPPKAMEAKPQTAKPEAKPEGAKPEAKKEAQPVQKFRAGGVVTAVDAAKRKITLTQDKVKKERKLILSVSKDAAKELGGVQVGDVVNVWVTGKTVTSLNKVF